MSKEELFELWGKVLKGDSDAKKRFVGIYISKFPPYNSWITKNLSKDNLHIMYLQLTK